MRIFKRILFAATLLIFFATIAYALISGDGERAGAFLVLAGFGLFAAGLIGGTIVHLVEEWQWRRRLPIPEANTDPGDFATVTYAPETTAFKEQHRKFQAHLAKISDAYYNGAKQRAMSHGQQPKRLGDGRGRR